jgi:LemA protein
MKKLIVVLVAVFGSFLVLALIVGSIVGGSYNGMVSLREEARTQQAEIENAMQRRADLVPQIVGATKGAMAQERAVFDDIAKAHAAFTNAPSGSQEKMDAGAALGSALRGYLVVAQQYPNLKSLDIVKDLTTTIEGTENRISVARTRYNEAVQSYNQKVQTFPTNIFAGMFGFTQMQRFEMDDKAKVAPEVNLDFENK